MVWRREKYNSPLTYLKVSNLVFIRPVADNNRKSAYRNMRTACARHSCASSTIVFVVVVVVVVLFVVMVSSISLVTADDDGVTISYSCGVSNVTD